MDEKKYSVGIVLSGGGARGFSHLGFLQALNDAGIFPDVISGTSAGALVGVLTADGYTPREILDMLNIRSKLDFMRPTLPREGLLQISGISKILHTHLRAKRFEDLKIPLYAAATDINNGNAVYFNKGDIIDRVIASMSIPVLFQPVLINNIQYLDGGITDNLPISPIEKTCSKLIGSFVNPVGYVEKVGGLISIAERTFMLNMTKEAREKAGKFDLLVAPPELMNYGILDPEKADELFDLGYRSTKEKLSEETIRKNLMLP
jgi:NTE family protein